jgi:hypothetical protein
VVRDQLGEFLQLTREQYDRPLPKYVVREWHEYVSSRQMRNVGSRVQRWSAGGKNISNWIALRRASLSDVFLALLGDPTGNCPVVNPAGRSGNVVAAVRQVMVSVAMEALA